MRVAGEVGYPGAMAPEVLARYVGWAAQLPEHVTSSALLASAAVRPPLQPPIAGRAAVVIRVRADGEVEAAEALLDPWRRWAGPCLDRICERPDAGAPDVELDRSGEVVTSDRLSGLTDEVIQLLCAAVLPREEPPVLLAAELRPLPTPDGRRPAGARRTDLLLRLVADGSTPAAAAAARGRLAAVRHELAAVGAATSEPLRG